MTELTVTFLLAVFYACGLSFGYGRKMDGHIATRPISTFIAVLIVIAGYAWSKQSLELFNELVLWFTLCSIPFLFRGGIMLFKNLEDEERERKQSELKELSVTSVRGDG